MSKPISKMTDAEVIVGYLELRARTPLVAEKQAHARMKLAFKDEFTKRGLELPPGTPKKARAKARPVTVDMCGDVPQIHADLLDCHGSRSLAYDGPKGHENPAAVDVAADERPTAEVFRFEPASTAFDGRAVPGGRVSSLVREPDLEQRDTVASTG